MKWERVVFSDESQIHSGMYDDHMMVRRRHGERQNEQLVEWLVHYNVGVIVWIAFGYRNNLSWTLECPPIIHYFRR